MSYSEELLHKASNVRAGFVKEGLADVTIEAVTPSPRLTEYRNKAQYPVSRDKNGEYVIGFYAPKSHTVCEASVCPMAPKIFTAILENLKTIFKKYSLSVYDEKTLAI